MDKESKAKLAAINGMTVEELDALEQWYEEHKDEVPHDEKYEAWKRYVESIQAIYLDVWQQTQMSRDIKPEQWKAFGDDAHITREKAESVFQQYIEHFPTWIPKQEEEQAE